MPETDRFLDLPDISAVMKMSKSALQRLIAAGEFPKPIRVGTASRWSELELMEWIEKKRNEPRETSQKIKVVHNSNNAA